VVISRLGALLCLLALPSLALGDCPGSARLEEALRVVSLANPVLRAADRAHTQAQRQRDWKAVLNLGYDTNTTFETGEAGARAAVRVEIPLWDRGSDLAKAEAAVALASQQDSTRVSLLADIQSLCELASQVDALNILRELTRDRLAYRQERVDQGLESADALWREAEAMQRAEHDWRRESGKLKAMHLTLARRYGGNEWQRLQALLIAMTH
jgi:hypothetical protein